MLLEHPDSAHTLSVRYKPGENKRLLNSNSEALFTFGDFRIERNISNEQLQNNLKHVHFDKFSTLESLEATNFQEQTTKFTTNISEQELNHIPENPLSHVYFSSFYTEVANSINNIIDNFPYAILSYNNGGINIINYNEVHNFITHTSYSTFNLELSALTNQGEIQINSGNSVNQLSLVKDYEQYRIQLSGSNTIHEILDYSFSGTQLFFKIKGALLNSVTATTGSSAVYIVPSKERMHEFKKSLTSLEYQLLYNGNLLIPDVTYTDDISYLKNYLWPKTIDNFAPDSYGNDFDNFKENILKEAEKIDEEKTNIFLKTIIPENFLEFDSEGQIFRTIIQTYAHEFDKLKKYIDAIAYAHSINYNGKESIPNKFLMKLSNLLGWETISSFNEITLLEYLTSDLDNEQNSYSHFNIEVWKRILINIIWLYKRKGTRNALMFIFRLLGAPDCLVNFNEFIYKIQQIINPNLSSVKIDEIGYINYQSTIYHFQKGGQGRGNGQDFINQWRPEFSPVLEIDNIKVQTGNTDVRIGTKEIINTKEVDLFISPSKAIECDVFKFYQNDCSCWNWGSSCPSFSALTVPYEYTNFSCNVASPPNITAMTLSEYIDYVFTNSINPRDRKTFSQNHTVWHYPELKNIYLNYYYYTNPHGHHLTIGKLEAYLDLIGEHIGGFVKQVIPATTIFKGNGSIVYKNPLFHRQKFVYKEGIDKGSTFQTHFPDNIQPSVKPIKTGMELVENYTITTKPIKTQCIVNQVYTTTNNIFKIYMEVGTILNPSISGWNTRSSSSNNSSFQLVNQGTIT